MADYETLVPGGHEKLAEEIFGKVKPYGVHYGVCSTAAATAAKTVTVPGVKALFEGLTLLIKFTNAQNYNGAPTLNVNGLGAVNIKRHGTTNAARYEWVAGDLLLFVYDGTYFLLCNSTADKVFFAEYGVTTYSEIENAYNDGKFIVVKRDLNGKSFYVFSCLNGTTYYFRTFSNSATTNYGCYINSDGTWTVNSYAYATLSSPTFTGTPTAPTAPAGTSNKQIATTAFVQEAINAITNGNEVEY